MIQHQVNPSPSDGDLHEGVVDEGGDAGGAGGRGSSDTGAAGEKKLIGGDDGHIPTWLTLPHVATTQVCLRWCFFYTCAYYAIRLTTKCLSCEIAVVGMCRHALKTLSCVCCLGDRR